MQNRAIDSALQALCKAGGPQGMLAEDLLHRRGVDIPSVQQYKPAMRRKTAGGVPEALKAGPMTANDLAMVIRGKSPDLSRRSAYNRGYQALLRLEERGLVCRDGGFWRSK